MSNAVPAAAPVAAVVIATAPATDGGAAALLPTPEGPVVARTVAQVHAHGVGPVTVVTRAEWADAVRSAVAPTGAVEVAGVDSVAQALDVVAEAAAGAARDVLLVDGEVVAHEAVMDAVLGDPRVATGAVIARGDPDEPLLRVRVERARVVAAESPYHRAGRAQAAALGVVKVGRGDRDELREAAVELAAYLGGPLPAGWRDELDAKAERWTAAGRADHRRDRQLAERDVVALLLTALCRRDVNVAAVAAAPFPCVRVYSDREAAAVVEASRSVDADALRLAAAVKSRDGFVTTHLVSPYSRYLARWAARRGLTPNQVTVFSMALGVAAALLFAVGSRPGLVAGAVVLWAAFVADCVDGQLARYTRQFSKLGAWLDALFDRAKEYVVFAGLAVGGVRAGDDRTVWVLAAAALALQMTRHAIAFSYGLSQRPPPRPPVVAPLTEIGAADDAGSTVAADTDLLADDQPQSRSPLAVLGRAGVGASRFFEQRAWLKWTKRIFVLPIGERFLVIAVTAALWGPRTVFVVLLVWGGLALSYTATGRLLRSVV